VDYRTVDLGGPIGYADHGGQGPAVVLVHGLGGSHVNWMVVAPRLAARHRVLALDQIGFGRTPLAGRTCSMEANLEALTRFVEEVAGVPALLVAHSMGGYLAVRLAAARPEVVAAAVLVAPASAPAGGGSFMPEDEASLARSLMSDPAAGAQLAHQFTKSLGPDLLIERAFGHMHARPVHPAVRQAHVELEGERQRSSNGTLAFLDTARHLEAALADQDSYDGWLRAITCPVLLVHGRLDPVVPAAKSERLLQVRLDWPAVWLEDVGHNAHMEAPEELLAAAEPFLAEHSGAGPRAR
jgi:glycerol-3-phosphate dehydrogenase